jgi:hypothetical protein
MADIIGYARNVETENGEKDVKLFMRGTPRFVAGSRFKYTPDYIDFNYMALVNAIGDAIDKQAAEDGIQYFTDTGANLHTFVSKELDFDELMMQFNTMIQDLSINSEEETFKTYWQPRITQIIEKYLGKGNRVSNCTREQVEALDLIITDLKDICK